MFKIMGFLMPVCLYGWVCVVLYQLLLFAKGLNDIIYNAKWSY